MMSQEATQPATQIVLDPRRLGQQDSDLDHDDLADICCILHPNSEPSRSACALIRQINPEYTIPSSNANRTRDIKSAQAHALDSVEGEIRDSSSYDIALRLSAPLKNFISGGFHFGRNSNRCDILIGKDASKRISNIHFRIYINEYGYLMLEDLSTNGTAVDGVLLRGNMRENGKEYQHLLCHNSLITLTMNSPQGEDDYRFLVSIPTRDSEAEEAYQKNLINYFIKIALARNDKAYKAIDGIKCRNSLNMLSSKQLDLPATSIPQNFSRKINEWRGGPKYNKVNRIGKGAFATVYLITSKYDGIPYAAKELEKRRFMKNGVLDPRLDDEMKIMRKIKHPNIVQFIEYVDWESYLYIIMEYVPGGDLGSLVSQCDCLPELDVKTIAGQLLSALKYLHQGGITHRDVKPDNILISNRNPLQIKLTDFGLSKMIESEETFLRTFCGTLLYCAPEVYVEYREFDEKGKRSLRGMEMRSLPPQRYGHAVDIWSLAGVLFFSLCGSPPYPVQNETSYIELLTRIMSQPLDTFPLRRAYVSETGIDFVKKMLHNRPSHRATIEELEVHPWLVSQKNEEVSLEDEIDMLDDDSLFPLLAEGTSQLNIRASCKSGPQNRKIANHDSNINRNLQFETSGPVAISKTSPNSRDGYHQQTEPTYDKMGESLFGEWRSACLASSDILPIDRFDFPLPPGFDNPETGDGTSMQPTLTSSEMVRVPGSVDPSLNPSGLLGTESLVGQLNMDSRSSTVLPHIENLGDATISLRRPRQDSSLDPWYLEGLLTKRRRKSIGDADKYLPKVLSRDMKTQSVHLNNNIQSALAETHQQREFVKNREDKFSPSPKSLSNNSKSGQAISATAMGTSIDPSESIEREIRRILLDPQFHSEERVTKRSNPDVQSVIITEHAASTPSFHGPPKVNLPLNPDKKCPQIPRNCLARLISTPDSCLPEISIYCTEYVTSWGRGSKATIRYLDIKESRIPKYAFKIFFFKPNFYGETQKNLLGGNIPEELSSYISTKASVGIWVNDFNLPSNDRQNPNTESKFWGQLNHGDIITVWRHDSKPSQVFTRFRFECYRGQSRHTRQIGDKFKLIKDELFLRELELACKKQEKITLAKSRP